MSRRPFFCGGFGRDEPEKLRGADGCAEFVLQLTECQMSCSFKVAFSR